MLSDDNSNNKNFRINIYCCEEFAREVDISIARYDDNDYEEALRGAYYLQDMENGKPSPILKYCPWCGSEIKKKERKINPRV